MTAPNQYPPPHQYQPPPHQRALVCPTCQAMLAPNAASCPRCGHVFLAPGAINAGDPVHAIGLVVVAIMILGILFMFGQAC